MLVLWLLFHKRIIWVSGWLWPVIIVVPSEVIEFWFILLFYLWSLGILFLHTNIICSYWTRKFALPFMNDLKLLNLIFIIILYFIVSLRFFLGFSIHANILVWRCHKLILFLLRWIILWLWRINVSLISLIVLTQIFTRI